MVILIFMDEDWMHRPEKGALETEHYSWLVMQMLAENFTLLDSDETAGFAPFANRVTNYTNQILAGETFVDNALLEKVALIKAIEAGMPDENGNLRLKDAPVDSYQDEYCGDEKAALADDIAKLMLMQELAVTQQSVLLDPDVRALMRDEFNIDLSRPGHDFPMAMQLFVQNYLEACAENAMESGDIFLSQNNPPAILTTQICMN